ncbi:MAG TPA: MFS transporter [Nitrososphaerales archaeon]|nr:MFS transporter [Nitrososphaerales archaeon]
MSSVDVEGALGCAGLALRGGHDNLRVYSGSAARREARCSASIGGSPPRRSFSSTLASYRTSSFGFIYTDLSYFLPNVQGVGAGLPIATMGVTLVVLSIPFGILADRFGRRKMLLLGNICASLSLLGFALTSNQLLVLVVAVLEGTGEAAYAVSFVAMVADKAGNQKRTAAFSLLSFLGWVAGALGSFAISSVYGLEALGLTFKESHIVLFASMGLLNLAITPLLLLVKETPVVKHDARIIPRKSAKVVAKYAVYSVLIAIGAGLFVNLMAFWFSKAYGVTDAVSGLVLGLTSLLTAGVVVVSPRLARKVGLVKATVLTQAASTVFMVAIPSAPTFGAAASLYLVRVFLMNLSNPLTQSLIMGLVSPDERGLASGVSAAFWRLPNSLSANVGYGLMVAGLLAAPFYAATVLYVAGILLFWMLFKDAKLPEEQKTDQPATQVSSFEGPVEER